MSDTFALPAVSLSEARAHLNISDQQSSGDAAELQRFVAAASAVAERFTCTVMAARQVDEVHDVGADGIVFLRSTPVIGDVEVSVDGGPYAVEAAVDRATGMLTARRAASRQMTVRFRAGMDPVPDHFKVGVLMIVAHLWKTQRPNDGRARSYSQVDEPSEMVAGYAVPRSALEMLGPRGVT